MGKASLHSIHIHPVKAFRSLPLREVVVEPWGPAGDRRWMLVDDRGVVVTQRRHPRLAPTAAELLPGGGVRLSAPGRQPVTAGVPSSGRTIVVDLFGTKVAAVPAEDDAVHAWCTALLGTAVRLVHLDDPATRRPVDPRFALPGETVSFADGFPLLLTTTASLDALNSLIDGGRYADEGPLPMNRFRPNVVVAGTAAWEEETWTRVTIGEAVFRVAKPCTRCVVTTTDQETSRRGKEPLHALAARQRPRGALLFGQNLVPLTPGATIRVGDRVEAG